MVEEGLAGTRNTLAHSDRKSCREETVSEIRHRFAHDVLKIEVVSSMSQCDDNHCLEVAIKNRSV